MKLSKFACAAMLGAMVAGNAGAAALFSENFNSSTISSELQSSGGTTWTSGAGSGVIEHQAGSGYDRNYIRTVDTNYNTIDFRMQVTFTTSGPTPDSLVFIGFGDGVPGGYGPGEPSNAIYMRSHPGGYAGYDSIAVEHNGNGAFDGGFAIGNGTHRLQIEKIGNMLTFSVDQNYTGGTFVADHTWGSYDLSNYNWLDATNSRLFFGTGTEYPSFDNLTITNLAGTFGSPAAVPEPASLALLGLGFAGLMAGRRRKAA